MSEVFVFLQKNRYQLPPSDFFLARNSKFFPFIHTLVMCNFGLGRSLYVTEDLCCSYGVPSLFVSGGLNHLKDQTPQDQSSLITVFNTFPVALALLTPTEARIYKSTLNPLTNLQTYSNLNLAIRKIVQSY